MDDLTAAKALGDLIRKKREQLYPQQKTCAYEGNVNLSHYNCIECGKALMNLCTLFKICRQLRIKPWELLEAALKHIWDEKEEE